MPASSIVPVVMTLVERIAKLETEHDRMAQQNAAVTEKLDELLQRFDKYEAKWGGVVMVVTAVGAILLALKTEIIRWIWK